LYTINAILCIPIFFGISRPHQTVLAPLRHD
jgi:hypothetical protein